MARPVHSTPAAADERRETPRIQLARLASQAAIAEPSVASLDGGLATRTTFAGTERLPGVVVVADDEGRHAVALFLKAAPTDLHALAERITGAVRGAAASAGLGAALGGVHVTFTDLTLPDEIANP